MASPRILPLLFLLAAVVAAAPLHAQNEGPAREADIAQKSAQEKAAKQNYDGAIDDWTRAMKAQPANAEWVYRRGLVRIRTNELEEAVADFTKAIDLKPDFARAYAARAEARIWLGLQQPALVDIERAMALEPGSAQHLIGRAELKRYLGNYQGALADNDAAASLAPKASHVFTSRAITRQGLGDRAGAVADFREALATDDTPKYTHLWLFAALQLKGEDGFADLARAVTPWPDAWDRSIGRYLLDSLPEKDFLARAEKAASADGRREQLCEAHYFIGAMALAANNPAKARLHFEKCVEQNVRTFVEDALARGELALLRAQGPGARPNRNQPSPAARN